MANVIRIGSIIHLQNGENGYLDTRGRVKDKPEFWNVAGTELLFVTTHEQRDRDRGSGSWRIVSADGKTDGEELEIGDTIHLLNMYPDAGYLDSCGWVVHLPPFKEYDPIVKSAVFTSGVPNRDNGTGQWKIESNSKQVGESVYEGDDIRLENGFPENGQPSEGDFSRAGFLMTHGDVAKNGIFNDHAGQLKFVFTSIRDEQEGIADVWKITLNTPPEASNILPLNTYYVWGEFNNKWLDLGVFELVGKSEPIVALNVSSNNEGDDLGGTVSYKGKAPTNITATWDEQNRYTIDHLPDIQWTLGGRDDKKLVIVNISSPDNGHTFSGKIKYAGEKSPIDFKGLRATTTLFKGEPKTILYDFFQQDLWKARIERMKEALQTAVNEFDDVLLTIEEFSIEKLMKLISNAGGKSYTYFRADYLESLLSEETEDEYSKRLKKLFTKIGDRNDVKEESKKEEAIADSFTYDVDLTHLNEKLEELLKSTRLALPIERTTPSDHQIDIDFQLKQLLNIYTLWLNMNEFWEELSDSSLKSMKNLNQVKILPPVHLIRTCFRQFTIDFEIIQNCIRQRRWVKNAKEDGNENLQAASLIVTDKLAARAMMPLKHLIPDSADIIPITFFSNKVFIRQLPYTSKFIFVGLTYDLTQPIRTVQEGREIVSPPFELMAIPHEIGHFMYHHTNLAKNMEYETFSDLSKMFEDSLYYEWCEEIFADLYACLIAGPFAVLGMQALIATEEKQMVLEDDDEHPTGIFRPYFLSKMLCILSNLKSDQYDFSEIAVLLDTNWTAILERWGYVTENMKEGRPARIHLPNESKFHTESFVNVDKALQLVNPIIDKFARELVSHAEFEPMEQTKEGDLSAKIPWCIGNDSQNGSLDDYIGEIQELVDHKFNSKQIPDIHLSSKSEMSESLSDAMLYALEGRNEFMGSMLFQHILEGWGDKGPHGTGGHI